MCLTAAFVPHRPNKYFHVIASNGIVSSSPYTPLAIMTASPIASVRVFETVRDADLATFGALPTSSMIDRAIIMLNDHRFWGHASGPSSSSGKTLSSFHPLLARPCRSALPRERFSPLALLGHVSFRFGADSLLNPYFRDFSRSLRKPAGAFSALAGGLRPQGAQLCRGRGP